MGRRLQFSPPFMLMILQRTQELERDLCQPPAADWREELRRDISESKRAARAKGQVKRLQ